MAFALSGDSAYLPGMGEESVIDEVQLDMICEECGPDIVPIFTDFIADFPGYFSQLQESAALADAWRVGRLAHQIKGSCATFGMIRFTERLREMELEAGSGHLPSPEELTAARGLFEESVRQVCARRPEFGS